MNPEKLKYPSVYAPMPINQIIGYDSLGYPIKQCYAYLAAPAYLISERKIYKGNGTSDIEYEVVFPHQIKDTNQFELEKVEPSYTLRGHCTNSIIVPKIDHDYARMKTVCKKKSSDLMILNNSYLPLKQLQKEHDKYCNDIESIYQQYEQKWSQGSVLSKKK